MHIKRGRSYAASPSGTPAPFCTQTLAQTYGGLRRLRCRSRHISGAFRVTPYKVKNGESLEKIAGDHGLDTQELLALNHELDAKDFNADLTILVPQGKLVEADRLILHDMKERRYRTYAVKRSESVEGILRSRAIEVDEFKALNPDVDPDNLADHEVIKLPAHKYSPHEQYEMHGSLGGPQTFSLGSWVVNSAIIGTVAIVWYSSWLYKQGRRARRAAELDKKIAAARKQYKVPEDLPTPSYMASVDEANEDALDGKEDGDDIKEGPPANQGTA